MLFLLTVGCGTGNVGTLSVDQPADDRIATGVTLGGYEVIRYNADGMEDPALNNSLDLRLDARDLVISVDDAGLNSVALLVRYDGNNVHPGTVDFHGIYAGDGMLSASFTTKAGIAGIGSAPIGGVLPGPLAGEFATVSFEAGALRTVSAPGDVHHGNVGLTFGLFQNLFGTGDTIARTASVSWTTAFHTGDGDQNKETNTADLTPIALFFGQNTATNPEAGVADYDDNGEVNLGDITPIALFFFERTDGFIFELADNDGSGRAVYPDSPFLWGDALAPTPPPVAGDFFSVFNNWRVDWSDLTTFTYDQLAAFDANADGFINAYVTNATYTGSPPVVDQLGTEAFVQVPVSNVPVETHAEVTITAFEVQVVGAVLGPGGDIFGNGNNDGEVIANGPVDFSLYNVIGTFDGEPFDMDTLPTAGDKTMTQGDYDDVFAACEAKLEWAFSDEGDADIRRTSSWVELTSGAPSPVTGDPGPGTAFPDDDPQSVAPTAEGRVVTTLPQGLNDTSGYPWNLQIQTRVLSDIPYTLNFDVLADDTASIIGNYGGITELELVVENNLLCEFDWGTGGEPADLATTRFQLVPIEEATGMAFHPDDVTWIELTYVPENPSLGEFTFFIFGDDAQIFCSINGADLQSDTLYAGRVEADGVWSSVNKPDEILSVRPFEAPDIVTLPEICGPEVTEVQLFPTDPQVRRNGTMTFDDFTGTPIFEDEVAFNDILKISTELDAEFPIERDQVNFINYPAIVVVPGNTPNVITGPEDPNHQAGVNITRRQGNKLVLDISVIPRPSGPAEELDYAFRIFTKDGTAFGEGTFKCVFLDLGTQDPIGIDWSVNLFDRAEVAIADRNHDFPGANRADGPSVNTQSPDVLWFEFSGGWQFGGLFRTPVSIEVEEIIGSETMTMDIRIEIAGVTPQGDILAFHPLHIDDFFNPIQPTGGILRAGSSFTMKIREATSAIPPFPYDDPLTVIGSPF